MKTHDTTKAELKKLTLKRETLRRLTSSELRLVAGGRTKRCTYEQSNCA
jgi:natural product precursor